MPIQMARLPIFEAMWISPVYTTFPNKQRYLWLSMDGTFVEVHILASNPEVDAGWRNGGQLC